jgi:hypothetical protein
MMTGASAIDIAERSLVATEQCGLSRKVTADFGAGFTPESETRPSLCSKVSTSRTPRLAFTSLLLSTKILKAPLSPLSSNPNSETQRHQCWQTADAPPVLITINGWGCQLRRPRGEVKPTDLLNTKQQSKPAHMWRGGNRTIAGQSRSGGVTACGVESAAYMANTSHQSIGPV